MGEVKRGRKPKIAGSIRPRKTGPIVVPAHLQGISREEYSRVALLLRDQGTLQDVDGRMIEAYAESHATRVRAWATLQTDGLTTTTDKGRPIAHPAFSIWREAVTRQKILGSALGLMGGVKADVDHGGDGEWAELLNMG